MTSVGMTARLHLDEHNRPAINGDDVELAQS